MKRTLLCAALLTLLAGVAPFLCLVLPAAPAATTPAPATTPTPAPAATASPGPEQSAGQTAAAQSPVLYDDGVGEVRTVSVRDYLVGAAACEMPSDWPDAAIQAQMVASHTYALYCRDNTISDQGYWLRVNSAIGSGWTDGQALAARWGEDCQANLDRLQALADEVADVLLLYDGAPALACYHAVSNGHTEASDQVWAEALPYLQGVDSAWDRYSDDYELTVQYTRNQVAQAAAELGVTLTGDPDTWIGTTVWDAAGYVQTIQIGDGELRGTAVRDALDLRSACFAIDWRGGQFVITTRGYGHGVGLSQYGARAMAEGGATWRQILEYYFPGCEATA